MQRISLCCTVVLLFLYFTRAHDIIHFLTHVNTRILYVFGIPAAVGLAVPGTLRRALSAKVILLWSAFVLWMILSVPTSVWRGGATIAVFDYLRANYLVLLLVAGLPTTWKHCRVLLLTMGIAGILQPVSALIFEKDWGGGRVGSDLGTLGNPNDLAGILLLLLPLTLYLVIYAPPIKTFWRVAGMVAIGYSLYLIVVTASRGAVVGMIAAVVVILFKATTRQRILTLALLTTALAAMIPLVPRSVWERLGTFSAGPSLEAVASNELRQRLVEEAITAALTHPVFGVGPGEFADYEGHEAKANNQVEEVGWRGAHNSYLEIAADEGIPGFLFYVSAAAGTFVLLQRGARKARMAGLTEMESAYVWLLVGYVGFSVAIFFLNFGYLIYLPVIGGISVAMARALDREIEMRGQPAALRHAPAQQRPMMPVAGIARPAPAPKTVATPPKNTARNPFRFGRYR